MTLTAGLWPFHAPRNNVHWRVNGAGLAFEKYGTVVGPETTASEAGQPGDPFSVEIWLQPSSTSQAGTVLAFYDPERRSSFSLHQSHTDLLVKGKVEGCSAAVYADDVFENERPVFVAVSLRSRDLQVYKNGKLVRTTSSFCNGPGPFGRLVLGTSPVQDDSWSGNIAGLAFYETELPPDRIADHANEWQAEHRPLARADDRVLAIYPFGEEKGRVVHNVVASGPNLGIPSHFLLLDQVFLSPPWREFYSGWSYWSDFLVNLFGFVPLGFVFSAYFAQISGLQRPAGLAVLVGVGVTLTIEILQAFLPTRHSGVTDLFTNTAGTLAGSWLERSKPIRHILAKILPHDDL